MLTCDQCIKEKLAYSVLHDMVLCPIAQGVMQIGQTCGFTVQDLDRIRKGARERANRLDKLYQIARLEEGRRKGEV